jgi:hypothetical protein
MHSVANAFKLETVSSLPPLSWFLLSTISTIAALAVLLQAVVHACSLASEERHTHI